MMACAELLAVCLLSADRGPTPRRQPLPIFHDIFRRADKNDDGKLSFEEFKNYFADGILSSEELWELFSGIDRRHSDNVDTEKLCDYFSAYLGEYRNVLSALEALNSAVLAAMDKTKLRYETSSKMEQFLTRFLLRETMHQLQSLQASLECAVDTVEEQAGRERKDIKKPEASVGLRSGRRCGRRGQKNVCLSPTDPYSGMLTTGVCVEDNSQWMAQINRLQQLIEKLECKSPRLEPLKEEAMCKGRDAPLCPVTWVSCWLWSGRGAAMWQAVSWAWDHPQDKCSSIRSMKAPGSARSQPRGRQRFVSAQIPQVCSKRPRPM
ncbi:N-terminal EF-hand calcium-binding protein 3 isoform X2 [Falco rusticolus]|uniref:N-terminal EF-hand calcium-binding protein 3 isoform X2 n=1 Tax=Falco rusticolus TaxID=120794 RepID=UPI001886AA2B|nr:N-terminal EF-hand calcium-binding protein 3 isoform X2 [Falco rusticolus]